MIHKIIKRAGLVPICRNSPDIPSCPNESFKEPENNITDYIPSDHSNANAEMELDNLQLVLKVIKSLIIPVITAAALYAVLVLIFHPYVISGSSMVPTFYDGDVITCEKASDTEITYGQVVIIKTTWWKDIIKRVVAVPGDTVDIKNGTLYVNEEPSIYNYDLIEDKGYMDYPLVLKENEYFCMGDNRNHSRDSREIGPIKKDAVKFIYRKTIISTSKY